MQCFELPPRADADMISSPKRNSPSKPFEVSQFLLPPQIEGDRFLPVRSLDNEALPEAFDLKMEIESGPPEALL